MIQVDMKSLLSKLNETCVNSLQNAAGLCVSRTHYEVTVEHYLIKVLEEQSCDLPLILRRFEIDPGRLASALNDSLEDFKTGNAAKPVFSPLLIDLFQEAWMLASIDLDESRVRSGSVLMAMLAKPSSFATSVAKRRTRGPL